MPAENQVTGSTGAHRPYPGLHGRNRNIDAPEGLTKRWLDLVARCGLVVVDIATFVDRPERKRQEKQAHKVKRRINRQADGTQKPESEIFLHNGSKNVSPTRMFNLGDVLAGQV